MDKLARQTPYQGLESGFCCCVARFEIWAASTLADSDSCAPPERTCRAGAVVSVSVKKTLLRRRGHVGGSASKTPNQGLEGSLPLRCKAKDLAEGLFLLTDTSTGGRRDSSSGPRAWCGLLQSILPEVLVGLAGLAWLHKLI